jgi:hypothetical protein
LNFGSPTPQISGDRLALGLGGKPISGRTIVAGQSGLPAKRLVRSGCKDAYYLLLSRCAMTDYLELNIETLGKTFRKQASGMRLLADEILDGEFRRGLLGLARDYDRRAEVFERGTSSTVIQHRLRGLRLQSRGNRRSPTLS